MERAVTHHNHSYIIIKSANLIYKDYLIPLAVRYYIRFLAHELCYLINFNVTELAEQQSRKHLFDFSRQTLFDYFES